MPSGRALLLLVPSLFACGSSEPQAERAPRDDVAETTPPGAPTETSAVANDPDLVLEELRCGSDEDCVATRFSGCCADADGTCPCEWHAMRRDVLEERRLECEIEECPHSGCPACPESEPPGPARCLDGRCQLRTD